MKNNVFLIIGLGSMGKRRIRCLRAINEKFIIYGFDKNKIRQKKVCSEYSILSICDLNKIESLNLYSILICTSPESHYEYMKLALRYKVHAFIEAGVHNIKHLRINEKAKEKNIILAPSCTMLYHPAIIEIKKIYDSNNFGRFLNMTYCSGQYLPDWHPYESVSNYYVSKKDTGGAREIVPFELTWITKIFGFPEKVIGKVKKTTNIKGAETIDDTYFIILEYKSSMINLNVDVISRKATRNLILNFENGQINWDWNNKYLKSYNSNNNKDSLIKYEVSNFKGYNKNISEKMYQDEISSFLSSIDNSEIKYPNSLENDFRVINLLLEVEKKD